MFYIIINPNAGKKEAIKHWPIIYKELKKTGIDFKYEFTEEPGHCINIVKNRIKEGFNKFICVGGDGTLNEIVNGVFKQKYADPSNIFIGLIPIGTGNDWRRYFNIPLNYTEAIEIIKKQKVFKQDVGQISHFSNGDKTNSYFINIAGLGFDSTVAKTTNKIRSRGNRTKFAYMLGLGKSLFKYKNWDLKIEINNEKIEKKVLSVSIGNGKYSGSGMIQTPNAIIDDGMLDVTIFEKMPKTKIMFNVNKLYNGKILKVKGIKNYRTDNIKIESKHKIFAETDGEIIDDGPYEISVLKKALNVYV